MTAIDQKYEFDCPKYLDFNNLEESERLNGDDWFGKNKINNQ